MRKELVLEPRGPLAAAWKARRGDTRPAGRQSGEVLRQRLPVRPLSAADHDAALAVCARDRVANAFVAARIVEGSLRASPGALLGHWSEGRLRGLAWVSANVVPVQLDDDGVTAVASRI